MAYRYSSNTSQFGSPHTNVVVAVKVDPAGNKTNEVLDSTTADSSGDFELSWEEWSGRVAIGALDDDETQRLQCVFVDGQSGLDTTGRYSGFTTLAPVFFYQLNEVASPWGDTPLVTAPTYAAPTTGYDFTDYIGAKGLTMAGDCLLIEQNAGSTDGFNFSAEMSITFLIKPGNDILSEQVICGFGDWSSNDEASNIQWSIGIQGSQLYFKQQYGSGATMTALCTQALIENDDIFVTVTRDATVNNTIRFYFNGEFVSSIDTFTSQRPTGGENGKFCVGGAYQGTLNYDGALSCLYGSDRVLSAGQIKKMYYQAQNYYQSYLLGISDLVFMWPMREKSLTTSYDISGSGHNGTHNQPITATVPAPASLGGTAVAFREGGAARYVDKGTYHPVTGSFSFGGWFNVTDLEYDDATYFNFNKFNDPNNELSIRLTDRTLTQQVRSVFTGSTVKIYTGLDAVEDAWEFTVVNFNIFTGEISFYKNGVLFWTCISIPMIRRDFTFRVRVGHTYGNNTPDYFKGYICGVFHIDRMLSASEIAELYAAANYTG